MLPRALPEIQSPLASPRSFVKYDVTMYTVGGKERPAPIPTKTP